MVGTLKNSQELFIDQLGNSLENNLSTSSPQNGRIDGSISEEEGSAQYILRVIREDLHIIIESDESHQNTRAAPIGTSKIYTSPGNKNPSYEIKYLTQYKETFGIFGAIFTIIMFYVIFSMHKGKETEKSSSRGRKKLSTGYSGRSRYLTASSHFTPVSYSPKKTPITPIKQKNINLPNDTPGGQFSLDSGFDITSLNLVDQIRIKALISNGGLSSSDGPKKGN